MPGPWFILTAAITPDPAFTGSAAFAMTITDPAVRAEQYRRALRAWSGVAREVAGQVAIVETSGATPGDLLGGVGATFVPFVPDPALLPRGKGAVEAAAIDYAIDVLAPQDAATLVKVTGRLVVANARPLVAPCPPGMLRARRSIDRRFIDSRFVVTTAGLWREHLRGMGPEVDDAGGRWLERVLAQRIVVAEYQSGAVVERFVEPPRYVGLSGTTGADYGSRRSRIVPPSSQKKAEGLIRRVSANRLV